MSCENNSSKPCCCKFTGINVPYILTWKNPYETGVALAKALVAFTIFVKITPQLFLKYFFIVIGSLSVIEVASKAISGTGIVSSLQPSRFLFISDYALDDYASCVTCTIRRIASDAVRLIDARSPCYGVRLAATAFFVYQVLKIVSLRNLVFVSIISAFSLPPLYLANKKQVDEAVEHFRIQSCEVVDSVKAKVHEKAGKQIDMVKNVLGPRGGFPGHANPSPVGEVPTAAAKPTEFTQKSAGQDEEVASSGASVKTSATTPSAAELKDITSQFDSVPTLAGNVPINHAKLNESLEASVAETTAAVNATAAEKSS